MKIIEFSEEYKEDARYICLQTGSEKGRTDPVYAKYATLLYCDEYCDHETVYLLIDGAKAAGYILCAENYETFKENMVPYIDQIKELGRRYAGIASMELQLYDALKEEYPAHMHIDILEEYTHGGYGTALFSTLLERLKKDHVKGLNLAVSAANTRAVSFYKKMGFETIKDLGSALVLGMKIEQN